MCKPTLDVISNGEIVNSLVKKGVDDAKKDSNCTVLLVHKTVFLKMYTIKWRNTEFIPCCIHSYTLTFITTTSECIYYHYYYYY